MTNKNQEEREVVRKMIGDFLEHLKKRKGPEIKGGAFITSDGKTLSEFGKIDEEDRKVLDGFRKTLKEKDKEREEISSNRPTDSRESARDFAKFIINELKGSLSSSKEDNPQDQVKEEVSDEHLCEDCSHYVNFEKKYEGIPGKFDYAEVQLGGRTFKIKGFFAEDGREDITMTSYFFDEEALKKLNIDELQEELNKAILHKKYEIAQKLLDIITNHKTSK